MEFIRSQMHVIFTFMLYTKYIHCKSVTGKFIKINIVNKN